MSPGKNEGECPQNLRLRGCYQTSHRRRAAPASPQARQGPSHLPTSRERTAEPRTSRQCASFRLLRGTRVNDSTNLKRKRLFIDQICEHVWSPRTFAPAPKHVFGKGFRRCVFCSRGQNG